jgi:ABC-type lipoprotein release transport system permease subunit
MENPLSEFDTLALGIRAVARALLAGPGDPLAAATTRLLQRLLYGVTPTDGVTVAAAAGVLLAAAVLACALPMRRALRVDPAEALRDE